MTGTCETIQVPDNVYYLYSYSYYFQCFFINLFPTFILYDVKEFVFD